VKLLKDKTNPYSKDIIDTLEYNEFKSVTEYTRAICVANSTSMIFAGA
jgi:hypothetical protein